MKRRTLFFLEGNKVVADQMVTLRKSEVDKLIAEKEKLVRFYDTIVAECGHDQIITEYRQRGELLRDEANRRKEAEADNARLRAFAYELRQ